MVGVRIRVSQKMPELLELALINLELKFPTKKQNPQINLPFNSLIQKFFFFDSPNWNIN